MDVFNLKMISYNCKHFVSEGPKFEFIDSLTTSHDVVLIQEHWLYQSQLDILSKVGNGFVIEAKSSMDENICRSGRPFGGCAILWNPLLHCNVTPIKCESPRLCGIVMQVESNSFLILNAYMPCDKGYRDHDSFPEFIDVLHEIKLLIDTYDTNFVIIGGDLNTDIRRNSPQAQYLKDFTCDNDLHFGVNSTNVNVPYTYISYMDGVHNSIIDHFVFSANLMEFLESVEIIDNNLFSDHVPLCVEFGVHVTHNKTTSRVYKKRVSWKKAKSQDIDNYKNCLDKLLASVNFNVAAVKCKDKLCKKHNAEISQLYHKVISACAMAADKCIPSTGSVNGSKKCIPGWNQYVSNEKQESLYWHRCWREAGCPRNGDLAEMMRITRARYHKAVKYVKKNRDKIRMEKMAASIAENRHRDFWNEVRKIKGRDNYLPACVDGVNTDNEICDVFSRKYESVYNCVSFDTGDMQNIVDIVNERITCEEIGDVTISVQDVIKCIGYIKSGKSDGYEGLYSDNLIHGCYRLYVILSMLFNAMLVHGESPQSMILGTMIPIPKNKRKSLCNSDNYRSIALSSICSKVLDWIILLKEGKALNSSNRQFGFKADCSTTQCTLMLNETISYYNLHHSSVYTVMLDATKAFDRVNYVKLFRELLHRNVSPITLRLLIDMYTSQKLCVSWGNCMSSLFSVSNGVKQGGVLSPALFAVYIDGLLVELESSGLGCYVGNQYTGALAYADDITLSCPTRYGMQKMLDICENYAKNYNIQFNGKKSQLLFFKGRGCTDNIKGNLKIFGEDLVYCDNATHLGHYISVDNPDLIVSKSCAIFWKNFNIFMSDFGHLHPVIKCQLFEKYCCSFYGSPLWLLHGKEVNNLCIAWRKALRSVWKVDPRTHCDIIHSLSGFEPLLVQLSRRFVKFIKKCLLSENDVVRLVCKVALSNPMSVICCNYRDITYKYGDIFSINIPYQRNVNADINASVIEELIDMRDGFRSCDILSVDEVCDLLVNICIT